MCRKYLEIFGKILNLLVIAAIVVFILTLVTNIGLQQSYMLYILIIVYILFLICEFCSPTFSFLRNKTNESGIKNKYGILVQTRPVIQFYCECYHYVTKTVRYNPPRKGGGRRSGGRKSGGRKSGGRKRSRTRTSVKKVVTHRETAIFPYYSCRDVSGLFQLKNSREEAMGKTYIKLELLEEINFADDVSYMDYEAFRTDFYNRNRGRDQYMSYTETRKIPGLETYNFVLIRDEEPCGVNMCTFILFTIIPLTELYKCYINSYCVNQTFSIRKLISTRYDLNAIQQYDVMTPSINVPNQQYVFEQSNYGYLNNQYPVRQPTKEELDRAAQYKNKIPNYQCVSYTALNNGQIKVGVVQDDPSYCSKNVDQSAPPNCQDVAQNPDMRNNMNLNMNMNMTSSNTRIMDPTNINNNLNNQNMNIQNANINANTNNVLINNDGGIDSNNNLNGSPNMNMNNNNNDDDDDDSEEGDAPYLGK
jgi:hypothetical protein